jgi:predicted permease
MAVSTGGFRRIMRRLLRTPLFTFVAILTLAVGIGANAAIFSVVYGVLLKPLPFAEPERLVGVWHTAPGLKIDVLNQSPGNYLIYREEGRVFEESGMWNGGAASVTGGTEPERVQTLSVTDGVLPLLKVQPLLGRLFTKADDSPGAPDRIVLAHGYWQRKFGGKPDIVGKTLEVDGKTREIIGVLKPDFKFLRTNPAFLLPMQINRAEVQVGNFSFRGIARLKPGVTMEQANADVARLLPVLPDRFRLPGGFSRQMFTDIHMGPNVRPLSKDVIGDVGPMLWVLLGTVGVVLLIACANVANLCLVRAEGRQQELALRAALGASRGRIAREMLTESVVLGLAGGALGLLLARAGIGLLVWLAPSGLPRLEEIGLQPIVLLFTLVLSLAAGLLFGLIPVFKFGVPSIAALKDGGRSTSEGPDRHRARNALVVSEIALALVLLVVSGLMIRTFLALREVNPGFTKAEEVQTFRLSIPEALIKDPEQVARTHQQILERLQQIPGVTSAGMSSSVTMDGNDSNDPIFVEELPETSGSMPPIRRFKWTAPGYVETMGNRILLGRGISWDDIYNKALVGVISEKLAREYWKNPADAIGKRIRQAPGNPWREIVGIVADERDDGVNKPATTMVYWPLLQRDFYDDKVRVSRSMAYVVRSPRVQSTGFQRELQQAVWSVSPSLPLAGMQTLDDLRADSMAQTSFALTMLAIAAAVALLLGVVGIYGVIAYVAAQRTREIGIRMALGAQPIDVSRLFLRHGLWLTGIGVAIGVTAALGLTRLMSSLLFGVGPMDPITYIAVSGGLGSVALLATYLPARRAARVEPMIALRSDA